MPEDRADTFLRMIRRSRRGRLKVYLGYAAGVGKTYQMLEEAHRLKHDGIDVVVGVVETHGREETAKLVEGLEVVPRRVQEYRGVAVDEMDLDAVLRRNPQVALVDEIAHTNVPGSRNAKRYEDVEDLLAAGVHVVTTLNVQHLESLYDTVERTVGVKVRERLPDRVLLDADQIVNVDLTAEDLQRRLREGKIYPNDRIESALQYFFQRGNLEQLRELTLRELAAQIDQRRREGTETETAAAPDQVMVCLSSRGPASESLLRYASRLAGKLNRNWYAVYVQTPSEAPTVIDAETQRVLSQTLTLAKQLGALVFTYKGEDVASTILHFAREYRVGHIVLGTPAPVPVWKRLTGKTSLAERLIQESQGATVVVLDTRRPAGAAADVQPAQAAVQPAAFPLTGILSPDRILIWDRPAYQEEVIRDLVRAACAGEAPDVERKALAAVLERESQGSTFLNKGAAFPHARLEGLTGTRAALGVVRGGVLGPTAEAPVEWVFLFLAPEEAQDRLLRLMATASRAAMDRPLLGQLREVGGPAELLDRLRTWEAGLERGTARSAAD